MATPESVYAFSYEAVHAHGAGRTGEITGRLRARVSPVPRENLSRWATVGAGDHGDRGQRG